MDIFDKLINDFQSSSAWLEFSLLIACLLLAYGAMRGLHARYGHLDDGKPSVWIGRHALDGALFPLLALVLVFTSQEILARFSTVFWLRVAVSLLVSLSVIRFVARVLSRTFPHSTVVRLIERIFSWLAWGAAVLHSIGLLPQVMEELEALQFNIGKTPVSLLNLIEGTLSAGLMMVAVLWLSTLFEQKVINQWVSDLSMRKVAMNITRSVLILVGLLVSLSMVGVDLTALSVMGGAIGVGLGFGMQKIASNYVSGFLVLIERALRIGDNVRVDGFEGRITDIRTRYTVIRALNGRESIVPNETLITQRVENLTGFDVKLGLSTTIVVGMDSDVEQVRRILLDAAVAQPRVLRTPAPTVTLVDFVEQGLQFSLGYSINDPQNGQGNVRSDVNLAVLRGLREAGIHLPVPRQVVQITERGAPVAQASAERG
ncbi:Potassium efflux system KefA precursor [Delftia tsuruhatensis]|uniref:mechanosensitive ion channel family protein n=1 Tax=Delftia tsuruhatensis TaxID=180282 RepID=UPI001E7D58FE|nr:mechanosensitive ion channel domain-containing protein [Delftia tsuruhatensis]CAB5713847.1 Potassium efflux system KefA precursor [Delftia tsuruhatensis]CAC9688779.1 Potassium efflux system KefA precursor [Delftia tsuruhatensis]